MTAELRTPDADAREVIRHALDETVFVEAAAGTGKTTALVGRIVSLLASGKGSLDRVVAVTFTEKAAGEMKLRLRAEIETALAGADDGSEARANLTKALELLELARIGTIHGFCSDLLHERPVEAGVDPMFAIADEEVSDALLDRAFDDWFQRVLDDPPEGVRRMLRRRAPGPNARGPREALRGAVQALKEHRDFDAPWRREPFDRDAAIDGVMSLLETFTSLHGSAVDPEDWLAQNVARVANWFEENALREGVRDRDHDALEAELRDLAGRRYGWHYKGRPRKMFSEDVTRDEVIERREAVVAALQDLVARCDADLAALLKDDLRPVLDAYEEQKRAAGVLDFVDLLIRARDLLVGDAAARRELQGRFSHYVVDEFQDTDPLQAEILLLLAADDPAETDWRRARPLPGRLFLVGDPKQSIYRFRRADVAIYESIKKRLAEAGARLVFLSTSFRAPPSLQGLVNAAFEPLMQGADDGSQARYVALEGAREEVHDRPTVVALPAPRPYGDYGTVVNWKVDESLPPAVGAFVHWLVRESGWTVKGRAPDGSETEEPIQARHVCLLFRRFKNFGDDVTRPYVRALEARGVPHVLVGGKSFHEREEVLAIRNALAAVEWPDDELRVFATLRGPLFALGDDALLAFKHGRRTLHPLQPLPDVDSLEGDERAGAESLAILRDLHYRRNRRPIADTVSRLLESVRAHAGIAIWPTGEQALANCLRVVDLARRFERRGAQSFRAFVERLEADALRGEAQDAPVVEEGTEGVRIMTAHRAKGLEFPVVVLCDPTCRATRDQPSRHVDPERRLWAEPLAGCTPQDLLDHGDVELARDAHEAVRLVYVAATRARDLLVVPVVGDHEIEAGWLAALNPVVYPETSSAGEGEPSAGCPSFGNFARDRKIAGARRPQRTPVRPGRLLPRAGLHSVVWWDPNVLALDVQGDVGLRQTRILETDESGVVVEKGTRDHERWRDARAARLERGAQPSLRTASVTELAEQAPALGASIPVEQVERGAAGRPHGKRFGTLVHAVLAVVDLDAGPAEVEAAAHLQGRLVGAGPEEVAAAVEATRAALAHPLLRRAATSDALRRETPVLLAGDDGGLAEGVVDLAFREAGRWTVVDFKTDVELGTRRDVYAAQVQRYVDAVAKATGEPAEGLLLVV
ncbi:MAG: UvrD-helicase domain-containing protein [Myxococcota bacterium]